MRRLPVAYGNSCFAKTWPNKTITFEELCARLEQTIRTTESAEEYPKLPKAERDRIKDKGGFVGGQLLGNRRKRETVVVRSLLTLDCDHAETDFISRFRVLLSMVTEMLTCLTERRKPTREQSTAGKR